MAALVEALPRFRGDEPPDESASHLPSRWLDSRKPERATTVIHVHPSDEELAAGVRDLLC